jgi:YfiH family protein
MIAAGALIVPEWPAPAAVRSACTTRIGGVSGGRYAGLNLGGGGDDAAAVSENRRRLFAALDLPAPPQWIRQVHGVAVARMPDAGEGTEADASVTTAHNVVCAVQSADCLPVLFCDRAGTVVAAAHAGWRGLAAGVLEATVAAMPAAPAALLAWMGPAIGPAAFEVGADVRAQFLAVDPAAAAAFTASARADHFYADLFALARQRLRRAGVDKVFGGGVCTWSDPARFYSFRRDGITGRSAALIWLDGPVRSH